MIRHALAAALLATSAAAADVEGSADHPLVPRYEGAEIIRYAREQFAAYGLIVGAPDWEAADRLPLEGRVAKISYLAPAERSTLEVFRNYEAALAEGGFAPLFSCAGEACGQIRRWIPKTMTATIFAGVDMTGDGTGHHYLAARRADPAGDAYVSLWVTRAGGGGPLRDRTVVQLDVVEIAPMQERMVVVGAEAIERDLVAAGRVALYGIHFDFDAATVRPDSQPQLDEIGRLLAERGDIEMLIVGHTDATGSHAYNLDLSQRRAESVAAALSRDYGIDRERLTPVGVGMAAPVASNRTEEGRGRNRRVELVER
jgi:OmpA-OmpF porin, OOP family